MMLRTRYSDEAIAQGFTVAHVKRLRGQLLEPRSVQWLLGNYGSDYRALLLWATDSADIQFGSGYDGSAVRVFYWRTPEAPAKRHEKLLGEYGMMLRGSFREHVEE